MARSLVFLVAAAETPVRITGFPADVEVVADRIEELGPDNLLVATGNVEVTRGRARILADRVEINRGTGDSVATGHVILYDGDDRLSGSRLDYNLKNGTGVLYDGRAQAEPYYRLTGEAALLLGDLGQPGPHGLARRLFQAWRRRQRGIPLPPRRRRPGLSERFLHPGDGGQAGPPRLRPLDPHLAGRPHALAQGGRQSHERQRPVPPVRGRPLRAVAPAGRVERLPD